MGRIEMGGGEFDGKIWKEEDEVKDVVLRGDGIKIDWEERERIHLAKDRDPWTILVNTLVNSGLQKCGDFLY
jgi:hypothetical protein